VTRPPEFVNQIPYKELGPLGEYLVQCREEGLADRTVIAKYDELRAVERYLGRSPATTPTSSPRDSRERTPRRVPAPIHQPRPPAQARRIAWCS
jgi:hypothetical protein